MIVKNEEAHLARVLESVRGIADEIIIVDTGSTDATKKTARKFTKRVYSFKWIDDFAAARNFAFARATKDFVMWLDGDDVVFEKDRSAIIELKSTLSKEFSAVTMRYNVAFDTDGNPTYFSTRGRLFNRDTAPKWIGEVHEYVPLVGKILSRPDIAVTHKPAKRGTSSTDRNIRIYEKKLAGGGTLDPRGKYYYARELRDIGRFRDAAKYFNLFLDEGAGWVEDNIGACFALSQCYEIMGEGENAKAALVKSFAFDAPRAEIASSLGYFYMKRGDHRTAAAWFETALYLPKRESMGFVLKDFHAYVPAIELAVCYDHLGDYQKADMYNEIAGTAKPNSPEYIQNKEYFTKKLRG